MDFEGFLRFISVEEGELRDLTEGDLEAVSVETVTASRCQTQLASPLID